MKTNINIFNNLNESLEKELKSKRRKKLKESAKNRKLNETKKTKLLEEIKHLKKSEYNNLEESEKSLNETDSNISELAKEIYEFYDSDMGTHFDEILGNEEDVYNETLALLENK